MKTARAHRLGCTCRLAGVALAAALVLACERKVTAPPPTPPPGGPPPAVVQAVFPPARSTWVIYDTEVWVQFAIPLDTTSISERTVFFKDETRRIASTLTWEAGTRRLYIAPHERLALRQTFTVELSAALRFADTSTLGANYLWQFTTNSLRHLESPSPMDAQSYESPFAALRWGGLTESAAGAVTYEVHASADSAAAADPEQPPLALLTAPPFVPRTRWAQDRPTYWAIHGLNPATGERLVGPVWRFSTFPVGAPYDSVPAVVADWDWVEPAVLPRQRCTEDSLVMGPPIMSTIRWNLGPPDTTVRLAGVAIDLTPRYTTVAAVAGPSVWSATESWLPCAQFPNGPPYTDAATGKLADAVVLSPTRIRFASDALSAHVEATRRLGGLYGYLFRAGLRRSYFGPGAGSPVVRAVMWLYLYRPPPPSAPVPLAGRPSGGYARAVPRR